MYDDLDGKISGRILRHGHEARFGLKMSVNCTDDVRDDVVERGLRIQHARPEQLRELDTVARLEQNLAVSDLVADLGLDDHRRRLRRSRQDALRDDREAGSELGRRRSVRKVGPPECGLEYVGLSAAEADQASADASLGHIWRGHSPALDVELSVRRAGPVLDAGRSLGA